MAHVPEQHVTSASGAPAVESQQATPAAAQGAVVGPVVVDVDTVVLTAVHTPFSQAKDPSVEYQRPA